MIFKHYLKGFSNYVFAKGGYIIRVAYVTKHNHYKSPRLVSYSRSDNRITLYNDKGRPERLSKTAMKKRGFSILEKPLFIPLSCEISEYPF